MMNGRYKAQTDEIRSTTLASAPALSVFTPRERTLLRSTRTPTAVQRFLNTLPYNADSSSDKLTLRSFRGVVRHQTAHCLEAVLAAAAILEQRGYPPLVLSFESIDQLDHSLACAIFLSG